MEFFERFGGRIDRNLKTERHVRSYEIVVNGFRYTNHWNTSLWIP
jgi:hypothetical protein